MPRFSPNKSLHILIADCNFPDCAPYFYNKVGGCCGWVGCLLLSS